MKRVKHIRRKLIFLGIVIIIIGIIAQVFLFYNEKMSDGDITFSNMGWSDTCDNKVYTPEEKKEFCDKCLSGADKCDWPLDFYIDFKGVGIVRKTGGEVHCFMIIDGIDYYKEKGSYYGITNDSLFTWQLLDASKPHVIEFCCGIERENHVINFLGLKKDWRQACKGTKVEKRC